MPHQITRTKCCCLLTKREISVRHLEQYQASLKSCPNCSTLFKPDRAQQWCSQSCAASSSNANRKYKPKKVLSPFTCLYCKTESLFDPLTHDGKFCCQICFKQYQWESVSIPKIERGEGGNLRRYLTEKHGYKCTSCGISDWQGKALSLQVDHIDGNNQNDLPRNLRFLCPNCHSQTETFGFKNSKKYKEKRGLL